MSGRGFSADEERFYSEMINKENLQRLEWFMKHGGYHEKQQLLNEPKPSEDKKDDSKISTPKIKSDKLETLAVMRPVEENVRNILYTGTSKLGEGRKKYLEKRYEKSPKEKYYFAESKNWEYGWAANGEIEDSAGENKNGRVAVILESFYRRGGVAEDPSHYRPPVNMRALIPFPTL